MGWVHDVLDVPLDRYVAATDFWADALDWPLGASWEGHRELRSFKPPDGAPYVHLHQITAAPRVHIDLECDDADRFVSRATALGAAVGASNRWQTLTSPGGLPFCVLPTRSEAGPAPTTWRDGHRSRMVQVCIDAPADRHTVEVGFWRSLLGARWVNSAAAEFAGKWHDDAGSPLQLLFQRMDEAGGSVRAHLDHGTDDLSAEVQRLLRLGAADIGAGHGGWHVLRDPCGLPFCVTENSPDQGRRRDLG